MSDQIAAEVWRGNAIESVHVADVAVVDATGKLVGRFGDPARPAFLRSAAKPLQAWAAWSCGQERLGIAAGSRELAIQCASHGATADQLAAVGAVLACAGVAEDALDNGAHEPLSAEGRELVRQSGQPPRAIHGNCSGKHAGMLAACTTLGLPHADYRRPQHPLQVQVKRTVAATLGLAPESLPEGVDGCGLPIWAVSMHAVAAVFARLGSDLTPIGQSLRNHPMLIGDPEGFNVRLMLACPEIAAKTGAEGVFCLGLPEAGLGLALKVRDGSGRAMAAITLRVLSALGLPIPTALADDAEPTITNLHGETVGHIRAVLPLAAGD